MLHDGDQLRYGQKVHETVLRAARSEWPEFGTGWDYQLNPEWVVFTDFDENDQKQIWLIDQDFQRQWQVVLDGW